MIQIKTRLDVSCKQGVALRREDKTHEASESREIPK